MFIAQRNDIRLQYLHVETGNEFSDFAPRIGSTRLLVYSGLGFALMSLLRPAFFRQRDRRTSAVVSGAATLDVDAIREAVESCRMHGNVTSENMVRVGRGMIAMPITVAGRQFAIAIGTTVQQLHAALDTLVETLRQVLLDHLACDLPPDQSTGASAAI